MKQTIGRVTARSLTCLSLDRNQSWSTEIGTESESVLRSVHSLKQHCIAVWDWWRINKWYKLLSDYQHSASVYQWEEDEHVFVLVTWAADGHDDNVDDDDDDDDVCYGCRWIYSRKSAADEDRAWESSCSRWSLEGRQWWCLSLTSTTILHELFICSDVTYLWQKCFLCKWRTATYMHIHSLLLLLLRHLVWLNQPPFVDLLKVVPVCRS